MNKHGLNIILGILIKTGNPTQSANQSCFIKSIENFFLLKLNRSIHKIYVQRVNYLAYEKHPVCIEHN